MVQITAWCQGVITLKIRFLIQIERGRYSASLILREKVVNTKLKLKVHVGDGCNTSDIFFYLYLRVLWFVSAFTCYRCYFCNTNKKNYTNSGLCSIIGGNAAGKCYSSQHNEFWFTVQMYSNNRPDNSNLTKDHGWDAIKKKQCDWGRLSLLDNLTGTWFDIMLRPLLLFALWEKTSHELCISSKQKRKNKKSKDNYTWLLTG